MSFIMRPIRFASTGHIIEGSGLFDGSTGYLEKTFSTSATNSKYITVEVIFKLIAPAASCHFFSTYNGSSPPNTVLSLAGGYVDASEYDGTYKYRQVSSNILRDTSAWQALHWTYNSVNQAASISLNGVEVAYSTDTNPTLNDPQTFLSNIVQRIGYHGGVSTSFYIARFAAIDGASLPVTDFGSVTDDGFWQINDASGLDFGNNGFLLEGSASIAGATNQVPDMTSATEPSGTVTTSHETSGQEGFHAFDRNTSGANQWNGNNSGAASLTYQFPSAKQITAYSIQNRDGNTNGAADTWQFQGSNNGSDFTTIQTISSAQSFGAGELKTYFPNNNTSYTHYRINVLTSRANEGPIISEWAMYENIDSSGNNSGWIQTGTITATNDSPTNDADNEYGNWATLDALYTPKPNFIGGSFYQGTNTYSEGNLRCAASAASGRGEIRSTISLATGHVYAEMKLNAIGNSAAGVGLISIENNVVTNHCVFARRSSSDTTTHMIDGGGDPSAGNDTGGDWTTGNSAGVAVDIDNNSVVIINPNTGEADSAFTPTSSMAGKNIMIVPVKDSHATNRTLDGTMNYGSGATAFVHAGSIPAGANDRMVSYQLPTPAIINPDDHFFSTVIDHDGSDTDGTCTFNLDTYEWLAIIKNTTGDVEKWYWIDSLNGVTKYLSSNSNSTQTTDSNVLTVSGTTFTLGSTLGAKNYLVEIHKAGLASATASNEDGSINTTATSFNATSGFTLGIYEGTATNATIGTGLSTPLEFLNVKNCDDADNWRTWHTGLTDGTYFVGINVIDAQSVATAAWNSTIPAATVFSIGTASFTNGSSETITYYGWHSVEGYSSFGSYEGTNSATAGPMINVGFNPRCALYKWIDGGDSWVLYDDAFDPINGVGNRIHPNKTNIIANDIKIDRLSNGSKIYSADGSVNSASTLIYSYWGGTPIQGDGKINQGRAR